VRVEVPGVVLVDELLDSDDDLRVLPAIEEVGGAGPQGVVVDILLTPMLAGLRTRRDQAGHLNDVVAHAGVERLPLRESIHEVTS